MATGKRAILLMAKSTSFYNAAIVAAKSVFFGSMATVFGVLIVSCANNEAIRSAPSIDAVDGLNNKLIWLKSNAQTGGEYVIELDQHERMSNAFFSKGNLSYKDRSNITITVRGIGEERFIGQESESVPIFEVGSGVTLILGETGERIMTVP
jgi:hypothetical protein